MDKRIWIVVVGILVVGIVVAILFSTVFKSVPNDNGEPGDPFAPSLGSNSDPLSETQNLEIALSDGSLVPVPDFTTNQPVWASKENGYQVAGTEYGAYQIIYFENGSGFLLSIFEEPIGENRLKAEEELRTTLRLSDAQLCKLSIEVAVSDDANEAYSGRNLGLSFCPGAVPLP